MLDLSALDANTIATGDQAFELVGNGAFSAAGQLRWTQDVANNRTIIEGNVDSVLAVDFQIQVMGLHIFATSNTANTGFTRFHSLIASRKNIDHAQLTRINQMSDAEQAKAAGKPQAEGDKTAAGGAAAKSQTRTVSHPRRLPPWC